jgi:hypothetical protein
MEETTDGNTGIPEEKPSICREKPSFCRSKSRGELAEERLGFLEIRGIKSFGEPVIADFRGAKLAHSSTQALQHFSRSMDGWSAVL